MAKNTVNTKVAKIDTPDGGNRMFILAIVAVVVLGLGGVAFLAAGRDSDISDAPQTAPVTIDGDLISPMTTGGVSVDAATDPAIGQVAPSLTGTSFDDSEVIIAADGRPKAVYFLAHWCPHCQREVPIVQGLVDAGQLPDGLDIYAVATSTSAGQANYPPETWLNREGWTGITVRDDASSQALNSFGGASFPYVVYLDGENRIVGRSSGELSADQTLALWQLAASTTAG